MNGTNLPQKAHFLPKYFPIYGTTTIVNSNSSCCNDSFHSLSASFSSSEEAADGLLALEFDVVGEEGRESSSEGETGAVEDIVVWKMWR